MLQDHSRNRTPMPAAQPPAGAAPPEPGPARAEAGIAQLLSASPAHAPKPTERDLARLVIDYFGDGPMDEFLDGDVELRDCARAILAASPAKPEAASAEAGIARMLTSAPSPAPASRTNISSDLRAALEELAAADAAGRAETSDDDAAFDVHAARQDAADDAVLATPCLSLADVGAKLTGLIPRIRPDLLNKRHADHLEAMSSDVDLLLAGPADLELAMPDPILSMIEVWRLRDAALNAFDAQVSAGTFVGNKVEEEERLIEARTPVRDAVLATVPTTPAGRAALVQFVRDEIDASGMADGGPPDDDHPIWRDGLNSLLSALEASAAAELMDERADESLLALGRRFDELHAAWLVAVENDREPGEHFDAFMDEAKARGVPTLEEIEAAWALPGVKEANDAEEIAYTAACRLANEILALPAKTVRGLAVKARAVIVSTWVSGSYEVDRGPNEDVDKEAARSLIESCCNAAGVDWRGECLTKQAPANAPVAPGAAPTEEPLGADPILVGIPQTRIAPDHALAPEVEPALADEIIACWREWSLESDLDRSEADEQTAVALLERHSALIHAAGALPATMENLPAKALALAWMEYIDAWRNGMVRDSYTIDGRLVLDIDTAICGRLKTHYSGEAA